MLSYVMVGSNDITQSEHFYSAFLPVLGYELKRWKGKLIYSLPGIPDRHNGPGAFYVVPPYDGEPATVGNGTMIAFRAQTHDDVRTLHAAGLKAGGTNEGAPGFRDDYGPRFYAAYLRDPLGNKIAIFCTNPREPARGEEARA
ncbi:VOC family protein [Ancylobacter oerskovii]|uniref:VOC family protein n=1 Tax=Ancylobacter oerskovii TaxID=459519 RepID=A0ABW4YY71_9HYPH|nr:VOC family protein [Ancylobacter oerskovii]MBS7541790.1 VOC family protein [Ancylobacter oerskovii]